MAEIAARPLTGPTAISTFSGCGGSSLGYRMAGYRVLWANEFIPAARQTYLANFPKAIVDPRDIRKIKPAEVLSAIGIKAGALDLMDGSPPCASFSTAGNRSADWGKAKKYSETVQRVDDLFFEYARLLKGIRPKVFVAENVSGLVKGVAKGYFLDILKTLKDCGYVVRAKLLDASGWASPCHATADLHQGKRGHGYRAGLPQTPSI
jgi:DNA (cytosine-5)-methyltransferase 1